MTKIIIFIPYFLSKASSFSYNSMKSNTSRALLSIITNIFGPNCFRRRYSGLTIGQSAAIINAYIFGIIIGRESRARAFFIFGIVNIGGGIY
jgi:hypothetical protein